MLYYGKKTPNINDIVFVYISEFSKGGTYCKLIEYGDIEGFILNTELDRKVYDPKKIFSFGETYPMFVLAVTSKGIDLSYKKVIIDDRQKLLEKFGTIKKICHLVIEYSYLTKIPVDVVSELTIWKLFGNDYLSDPKLLYNSILKDITKFTYCISETYPEETKLFIENITSRITMTNMIVHQNFDLMICDEDAISKLKQVLIYDGDTNTQVKYISSPRYQISVTGDSESTCEDKINKCLDFMKDKMKTYNTIFKLQDKVIAKNQEIILKPLHMI